MKRKIGISVYPEQSEFEKDKEYLDLAFSLGYRVVFTSVLHFVNDKDAKNKAEKVLRVIKYAKQLGFYTILDVEYKSMELIEISLTNFKKCLDYGIDCLRLDSPSLAGEIANVTHNKFGIDIQLNMSNNDHLISNVMDYGAIKDRLSGCHNFYPLRYTALGLDFFEEANKKYLDLNISTAAFIGSHSGTMTTAVGWKELPTLEVQRDLDVLSQAKILFYSNQIDTVLFGNAYATYEELLAVSKIDMYEITFDLKIEPNTTSVEKEILLYEHQRRMDINNYFIRSTFTRVVFKDANIEPNKIKSTFNIGDVVIINNNDPKYKGECLIILQNNFEDLMGSYNYIGTIKEDEKYLLKYVKGAYHFRFNLKENSK